MKQVSLDRPEARTWGGRRKGAGRKPAGGKKVPHVERPWHDKRCPVHVTVPIVYGLRLRNLAVAREIGESFRALVGSAHEESFRVVVFSLQNDHVHLVVEARDRVALQRGMRAVTIRIAKATNRALGRRGRVIRERYHAHVLATPTEAQNALRYVIHNGRKHGEPVEEFVDGLDTRSSARWFLQRTSSPAPTSEPRTHFVRRARPAPARSRCAASAPPA